MSQTSILKIKDRITFYLKEYPHLRDSDEKLIASVWKDELIKQGFKTTQMSAYDFLKMYSDGKLTSSESIGRCRRKIQETTPELRGALYVERKNNEESVKSEIRQFAD